MKNPCKSCLCFNDCLNKRDLQYQHCLMLKGYIDTIQTHHLNLCGFKSCRSNCLACVLERIDHVESM